MSEHSQNLVRTLDLGDILEKGGFKYKADLIQVLLGGSDQHGAKLESKGDLDVFGIYIEHPSKVLGISTESHFTGGTSDQYERNKAGDEDYKVYTLKRWAGLAAKGNPTILGFLFSRPHYLGTAWNQYIVPNTDLFMAKSHANAFIGFATSQIARLKGEKGQGKHGQRPELEAKHGYDVKAAMHCIRMMHECEEFLRTGHITYPRPEVDKLISIRKGEWTLQQVFDEHYRLEQATRKAEDECSMPDHVDRDAISEVVTKAYLSHWKARLLI